MRLLDVRRHRLKSFIGDDVPPYAILSHTWGKDEVLFEHIRDAPPTLMEMDGWKKVHYACTQARLDGYDYVWIDTCCIDKSSSAELSEAINSMFKWYLKAAICYAYLSDVNDSVPEDRFEDSRWFTRGWTLQELIAPCNVIFYDWTWKHITSRQGLSAAQLAAVKGVTNLPDAVLRRDEEEFRSCQTKIWKLPSHDYNAQTCRNCSRREDSLPILDTITSAERMSWAARRATTRIEDRAYSLLGLFGVSMPLLYGEGSRAFLRLQEEILKQSHDQSLFAFARPSGDNREGLLAESPDLFTDSQITGLVKLPGSGAQQAYPSLLSFGVTARSVELEMMLYPCQRVITWAAMSVREPVSQPNGEYWIGLLACAFKDDLLSRPAIILKRAFPKRGGEDRDDLQRVDCQVLVKVSPEAVNDAVLTWTLKGFGMIATAASYPYEAEGGHIKIVRLQFAPTTPTVASKTLLGNTAVSTAAVLTLPAKVYKYLGGAPGTGRSIKLKRIKGPCHRDQYYIPSTPLEELGAIPEFRAERVLGILCIGHTNVRNPFLSIWGLHQGDPFKPSEQRLLWCKVLSAFEIDGWSTLMGVDPGGLLAHLLRSGALGRLVGGWEWGGETDVITSSIGPFFEDKVTVKRVEWLGSPLFEIEVSLGDV